MGRNWNDVKAEKAEADAQNGHVWVHLFSLDSDAGELQAAKVTAAIYTAFQAADFSWHSMAVAALEALKEED